MTKVLAREVLAIRDFRLFLMARLLASSAQQITTVAVGWLVYDLTHDPLTLGLVGLAQFVPALLLTLAGLLVERWLMFAEATHTVTLFYRGT